MTAPSLDFRMRLQRFSGPLHVCPSGSRTRHLVMLAPWPPAPPSFDFFSNSFPSGHVTEAAGLAIPLSLRFRRPWLSGALALRILLVGYSRIWLGWHHPVDLLGGLAMGSISARLITHCPAALRKDSPEATPPPRSPNSSSAEAPSAKERP